MMDQEINEAVARKLGVVDSIKAQYYFENSCCEEDSGKLNFILGDHVPDYAGSIQAAWEIVEKIKDWELQLVLKGGDRFGGIWHCCVLDTRLENPYWIDERADTAPKAICLAFLKL